MQAVVRRVYMRDFPQCVVSVLVWRRNVWVNDHSRIQLLVRRGRHHLNERRVRGYMFLEDGIQPLHQDLDFKRAKASATYLRNLVLRQPIHLSMRDTMPPG